MHDVQAKRKRSLCDIQRKRKNSLRHGEESKGLLSQMRTKSFLCDYPFHKREERLPLTIQGKGKSWPDPE